MNAIIGVRLHMVTRVRRCHFLQRKLLNRLMILGRFIVNQRVARVNYVHKSNYLPWVPYADKR